LPFAEITISLNHRQVFLHYVATSRFLHRAGKLQNRPGDTGYFLGISAVSQKKPPAARQLGQPQSR